MTTDDEEHRRTTAPIRHLHRLSVFLLFFSTAFWIWAFINNLRYEKAYELISNNQYTSVANLAEAQDAVLFAQQPDVDSVIEDGVPRRRVVLHVRVGEPHPRDVQVGRSDPKFANVLVQRETIKTHWTQKCDGSCLKTNFNNKIGFFICAS